MAGYLDHPFHFDRAGRTATTQRDDHVRDMIYQVLFTNPGERLNRPDFGCGLLQLVFEPADDALAATTEFLVQGALEQWLGDVIQVDQVEIEVRDGEFHVEVVYTRLDTGERHEDTFSAPVGGA